MDKVSVVTCFYNVEQYLQEAIESVLHQSYTNWELLLIDDGSIDNGSCIAKQYASRYPNKIVYFEHKNHVNKGLSASRNLALAKSSGKLITFLDADDVWLPEYLEAQIRIMQEKQVSVICEATEYWYSWENPQTENHVIYIGTEQDRHYYPAQLMLNLYPLGEGAAPCMCGIILNKELLIRLGGFEDTFRGMYEDQVFLSKLYLHEPIYISSRHNNLYRQRPDSLVGSSRQPEYHKIRKQYLNWLRGYLLSQQIFYPEVDALLQRALIPYTHPPVNRLSDKIPVSTRSFLKKWLPHSLKLILNKIRK